MNLKSSTKFVLFFVWGLYSVALLADSPNSLDPESPESQPTRPNILWLSTEDIGCQLSCYGDKTTATPNLDRLAKMGMVYDVAWSNYPVCAPARTTIITGMYAAANGAGNMRSNAKLPKKIKMFPQLLREAGYACYNCSKEDYNHPKPGRVWDMSSGAAHYHRRKNDHPFFSVFNYTRTHESRIRKRPHKALIDPASVNLIPYWPDTPKVRQDWAQYYDNLTGMDKWLGKKLDELERSRLADSTIVIFFGDHGSGMPRHKRYAGDSGMHVPFVVYIPEELKTVWPGDYQPGGRTSRPVGFVDLAPSMLSVAGVPIPDYLQGTPFLGAKATAPKQYVLGLRDRMDERVDFSRSIRDERFLYIRNFMPHLPHGQTVAYQMETPTTRIWKRKFDAGELNEVQAAFWKPKAFEELYDLKNDPHETKNLAKDPVFAQHRNRLRTALRTKLTEIRDSGFLPEPALEKIKVTQTVREFCSQDKRYPFEAIYDIADSATSGKATTQQLVDAVKSENATIRYWAMMGFMLKGAHGYKNAQSLIKACSQDADPSVAILSAELMVKNDEGQARDDGLMSLLRFSNPEKSGFFAAVYALNAIDRLDQKAKPIFKQLESLPKIEEGRKRGKDYLKRLHQHIRQGL